MRCEAGKSISLHLNNGVGGRHCAMGHTDGGERSRRTDFVAHGGVWVLRNRAAASSSCAELHAGKQARQTA